MPNNGQTRRAAKAAGKVPGVKIVYNEGQTRKEKRLTLNTMTSCPDCGDKMAVKHLTNHVRRAMLHQESYDRLKKEGVL